MPLSLPQYAAIKYRQYQANQQTLTKKKSKVAGNNLTVLPINKEKQKNSQNKLAVVLNRRGVNSFNRWLAL